MRAGAFLFQNPHSSFFYLFTGLHALHLIGGLVALFVVVLRRSPRRELVDVVSLLLAFPGSSLDRAVWHAAFDILRLVPADPSAQIAPTARIHPDAMIGPGVVIGEFAIVEQDVTIGAQTRLEPYVYVKRWTTLGERNQISAGTVLGTDPLDKNFTGARSYLRIGDGNIIREHYTDLPRHGAGIGDGHRRRKLHHDLGTHRAQLPDRRPDGDRQLLAGGGIRGSRRARRLSPAGSVIHQYSRIGRLAMIGGNTRVNTDVPPYFPTRCNVAAKGLNLVGLKRAGFTRRISRRSRRRTGFCTAPD